MQAGLQFRLAETIFISFLLMVSSMRKNNPFEVLNKGMHDKVFGVKRTSATTEGGKHQTILFRAKFVCSDQQILVD